MFKSLAFAGAVLCASLLTVAHADARQRAAGLHPDCNITMPCQAPMDAVTVKEAQRVARGKYVARQMGIGGVAPKPHRRAAKSIPVRSYGIPATLWATTDLVSRARSYMGTNPTGWRSLWCGRFMAMIAPQAAARVGNPNLAKAWLALPRTSGNIGDIAVMGRRGGGHVGVVTGFDGAGNPIIVSGNAGGHAVREGTYSRHRILAFVSPS